MKRLMLLAASALVALTLAGCGAARVAQTPIGDSAVHDARNTIFAVKSGYAVTVRAATAYVKLPACDKPPAPTLCSRTDVVVQLSKAQAAASATINNAEEAVLRATGASTVLGSAVDAAKAAYASFKGVLAVYNIKEE